MEKRIEEMLQDKIGPHIRSIEDGNSDEHDILPALFGVLLERQRGLSKSTDEQMQLALKNQRELRELAEFIEAKSIDRTNNLTSLFEDRHAKLLDLLHLNFGDLSTKQHLAEGLITTELKALTLRQVDLENALKSQRKIAFLGYGACVLLLAILLTLRLVK